MSWKRLTDVDLAGRKVFLRADLNVPLEDGRVAGDARVRAVIPTIEYILKQGASIVLASHLGRPGGVRDDDLSLAPVAEQLSSLLEHPVILAPDCVGKRVEIMASSMSQGQILLLENLRFHPEEKANDPEFARSLAGLADIYVNDAFGTCHRDHASMTGIPRLLGGGVAGFLLEKELDTFARVTADPDRPFTLLLGGAKVSDKVLTVDNLLHRLDNLLIGGGMAFTFLAARGFEVGGSLLEKERVELAKDLLARAGDAGVRILLPQDIVVAPSADEPSKAAVVPADAIPPDMCGLDVGPGTLKAFADVLLEESGGTIVWNGPLGLFEVEPFDAATREVALLLAEATKRFGTKTIVGGGDSVRAVSEAGVTDSLSLVSTGGGASLKLLQGKELVAVTALSGG